MKNIKVIYIIKFIENKEKLVDQNVKRKFLNI